MSILTTIEQKWLSEMASGYMDEGRPKTELVTPSTHRLAMIVNDVVGAVKRLEKKQQKEAMLSKAEELLKNLVNNSSWITNGDVVTVGFDTYAWREIVSFVESLP